MAGKARAVVENSSKVLSLLRDILKTTTKLVKLAPGQSITEVCQIRVSCPQEEYYVLAKRLSILQKTRNIKIDL
jgi:hypothetical protein